MTHTIAIAGLVANMIGTLLLLAYPTPREPSPVLGEEQMASQRLVLPSARRSYQVRLLCFRGGIALLAAGFLLQLIDLIHS